MNFCMREYKARLVERKRETDSENVEKVLNFIDEFMGTMTSESLSPRHGASSGS